MAVGTHDDPRRGVSGGDGEIETGRRPAGRVVNDDHPRLVSCQVFSDVSGAILGRTDRDDQLECSEIVLGEHAVYCIGQVLLLVERRHDHRYRRRNR
jgi:hypothetical protein